MPVIFTWRRKLKKIAWSFSMDYGRNLCMLNYKEIWMGTSWGKKISSFHFVWLVWWPRIRSVSCLKQSGSFAPHKQPQLEDCTRCRKNLLVQLDRHYSSLISEAPARLLCLQNGRGNACVICKQWSDALSFYSLGWCTGAFVELHFACCTLALAGAITDAGWRVDACVSVAKNILFDCWRVRLEFSRYDDPCNVGMPKPHRIGLNRGWIIVL